MVAMDRITQTCTCDDNCDDPCPMHARENALQDRVIELENALRTVDELRHRMKAAREQGDTKELGSIVDDLKKPCMVLYAR